MLLPKSLLDKLEFYSTTVTRIRKGFENRPCTQVTIHFKKWYRPSKTFTFEWICSKIEDDIRTYTEVPEAVELINQLKKYFNANV